MRIAPWRSAALCLWLALRPAGLTTTEERSPERVARACEDIRGALALWDTALTGDCLAGPLSAVDFTLYPELALVMRIASRNPGPIRET
jgi:hypothetical protein